MRFKRVGTGYKCSCRPTDKYFQERVGISLTRNKDKATSDLLVKVSPGTKPWMTLSPTSASCHALRCVVLQQLSRHETTPGCRAGFVAPVAARTTALCGAFAFAPGGLAAAPAAGLRGDAFALASGGGVAAPAGGVTFALTPLVAAPAAGLCDDNTGSSTTDFIGLDGSSPTKKRTGGPLDPGDGESPEHGGSGKKQASTAAAASLALASAGQEMELLMYNQEKGIQGKCSARDINALCSCVQLTAIAEQERGEGGVTGKSTKSCLLTRNQKPVIDLP